MPDIQLLSSFLHLHEQTTQKHQQNLFEIDFPVFIKKDGLIRLMDAIYEEKGSLISMVGMRAWFHIRCVTIEINNRFYCCEGVSCGSDQKKSLFETDYIMTAHNCSDADRLPTLSQIQTAMEQNYLLEKSATNTNLFHFINVCLQIFFVFFLA